jgi:hypothetical protein
VVTNTQDPQRGWPTVQTSTVLDVLLQRDADTIALEEEWRNGSPVEDEA